MGISFDSVRSHQFFLILIGMKNLFLSIGFVLLIAGCCTTTPVSHGIPNFKLVDAKQSIYRGGQPSTNGFNYLKSIGITNIVKLNTIHEGSDEYAKSIGIRVVAVPFDTYEQMVYTPLWKVDKAATNMVPHTLVHCEHGQDRTGLVVMDWEVKQGVPKKIAVKEMLDNGFHKVLRGLWECAEEIK